MNGITLYIKEAYNELVHKVTWPTFKELQNSAVVVLVATIIIAVVVSLMNVAADNVMKWLYSVLR